ncbi:MAG TPA: hypothetical protein PKU80_01240 [Candidatus Limiplasma sp.]|nr:hypothetical protein [Candidatus Limiplasma sp.]
MKGALKHTRAIIICHGKSEMQICRYIRANLRLPIEVDSDNDSSIQIESLERFFKRRHYRTAQDLYEKYSGIACPKKGKLDTDFKIFTWMDIDECQQPMCDEYKNGIMFKERWFYPHLHPIYCDPKLEVILTKAGMPFKSRSDDDKKREYIKLFPTDPKYKTPNRQTDREQIEEFYRMLLPIKNQNLHELVNYCLMLEMQQKSER